ncbi:hypothetical protein [Pseudobutyrivibrio xylanivorans]|uniref:Capsular polysaccharide biosynthesis protein n=1 Tax=Pseudobutyrivibrio xylanivorans DSM 14809 TaxID=1123012 RepID=A0A1M6JFW1_PSEXY|nr:hypothetical protein [Pseudobutyrivibrio xylanivorans]SHJ45565.1 hypothetical protein SAMN02745725_02590 [Pseudobutyrivibrio xylanivorans DSM 14809]
MNENYVREIDLIDLFVDWLSHWRSLLAFLIVGVILAGGYMFLGSTPSAPIELDVVQEEEEEEEELTAREIKAVEEVIALNDEYEENVKLYEAEKDSMEPKDRAEAFYYIVATKNSVEGRKGTLNEAQLKYLYGDEDTDDSKDAKEENVESATESVAPAGPSKTKALLIVILAVILHFIVFACRYIFDNKIKHTDTLSAMTGVPEYTRMVDWSMVDSKKGLDKLVNKMRFAGIRRTSLTQIVEINSSATIEKLKNKNYSSIAVVGTGIDLERNILSNQILKDKPDATVKSIDSITHSVNGADDIAGVDAAILAVKVAHTRYNDFMEELQSLRDRGVDVLGIAIFE